MSAIGKAHTRLDGPLKVTGGARYGSDADLNGATYGVLLTSTIAKGTVRRIDESDARQVSGIIEVFTHHNIGYIKPGKMFADGGYVGTSIAPLNGPDVLHDGQIIALVVAEELEAAQEGAARIRVEYDVHVPAASFTSVGTETVAAKEFSKSHEDPCVGDADGAYSTSPVQLDETYGTATQHHNPIELFTTACVWDGDRLTVWESSQNVWGAKTGIAEQLGISPEKVRIVCPFIGGAFGSRGSLTQRTAIVARAAQHLRRPIKLMTTRAQGFSIATYRAETRHRLRLGADEVGRLQSLTHEGSEITSRPDSYMVAGTDASTRLYRCPNISSNVSVVHADRNTPGFMRSPPETPYIFALECAMDELAYKLGLDPIELRRVNDASQEPIEGKPYSSRSLMACFDIGAKAFGWYGRTPLPKSMRDGDWLVGYGTASTLYPSNIAPAAARVTLRPDGTASVQTATHEIGTGIYTVLAQIVAAKLGIDAECVQVAIGDSDLPPSPVAGGSNTTASVGNVVAKACDEILLRRTAGANGAIEAYAENIPKGAPDDAIKMLYRGKPALINGASAPEQVRFAYGAQFVEVRVHHLTREIRVARALGAFAAGTIVNPLTAKSQLMGGMIWGISAGLFEATEIDQHYARYYNTDLEKYLIPVNADCRQIEVIFVPEKEEFNELGVKGIGELGNVGMNAAVVNAIFHATGIRVRRFPVRLEDLLATPDEGTSGPSSR